MDESAAKPFQSLPSQPAFALIACQRTGTHLLREIVNSNPDIALVPEPFSVCPEAIYWHNFVRTLPDGDYPPQYPADAIALMDKYLLRLREDVAENDERYGGPKRASTAIGLDIKYNQLRCFGP